MVQIIRGGAFKTGETDPVSGKKLAIFDNPNIRRTGYLNGDHVLQRGQDALYNVLEDLASHGEARDTLYFKEIGIGVSESQVYVQLGSLATVGLIVSQWGDDYGNHKGTRYWRITELGCRAGAQFVRDYLRGDAEPTIYPDEMESDPYEDAMNGFADEAPKASKGVSIAQAKPLSLNTALKDSLHKVMESTKAREGASIDKAD